MWVLSKSCNQLPWFCALAVLFLRSKKIHWSRDLNISKLNDVVRRGGGGGGKEGEGQRFLRGDNFTKITNKNVNKHDS